MLIINEGELAQKAEKTEKLWGAEYLILNNERYCCKFLKINPGFRSSIHCHAKKDETFIGVMGTALLTTYTAEGQTFSAIGIIPGVKHRIMPKTYHSFEASGTTAWVMEVSTPHNDQDVKRLEESKKLA